MNKLLKIDNIMYYVSDPVKALAFYQNVLGLKEVWEDKDAKMIGFTLEKSDAEVVIHWDSNLPEFDYSYLVENVEEFVKDFKSKGGTLDFGPIEVRPGKCAILLDPDGNKIPIIDLTRFGGIPRYN